MTVVGVCIKIFKILFLIRSNIYGLSYAFYERKNGFKKAIFVILYVLLVDLALVYFI